MTIVDLDRLKERDQDNWNKGFKSGVEMGKRMGRKELLKEIRDFFKMFTQEDDENQ